MSENENIIDIFKKSLTATIKSIGKIHDAEISFVAEKPSINGKQVNLPSFSSSTLKHDLNYVRGEDDAIALELRLHNSNLHNKFLTGNEKSEIKNRNYVIVTAGTVIAKKKGDCWRRRKGCCRISVMVHWQKLFFLTKL